MVIIKENGYLNGQFIVCNGSQKFENGKYKCNKCENHKKPEENFEKFKERVKNERYLEFHKKSQQLMENLKRNSIINRKSKSNNQSKNKANEKENDELEL